MSRDVKFRAWHKNLHLMQNDVHEVDSFAEKLASETYEIMQYTGLKDKNGNEIYEGDIVRWEFGKHYWEAIIKTVDNSKSNTLYAIETFNNVSTDILGENYTFERIDSKKGCRNDIEYLNSNIEIIGNIYSNPELLTK